MRLALWPITAMLLMAPVWPRAATIDVNDFAWQMHQGAGVPMDAVFRDEAGAPVTLREAAHGLPVVLDLGYFHCPTLCGVVRSDLLGALKASGLTDGRDYALLSVSIDPAETSRFAADAKATDLAQSPFSHGLGWHYLTGEAPAIAALTSAVGFRDRYDMQLQQFLHPVGLVVLTRAGVVSGYLQGVGYTGGDLRAAVVRAGDGGIAKASLPILLLCFHFDETTGRYTLAIEKVLKLAGALTVLTIGGLLLVLHRHRGRDTAT